MKPASIFRVRLSHTVTTNCFVNQEEKIKTEFMGPYDLDLRGAVIIHSTKPGSDCDVQLTHRARPRIIISFFHRISKCQWFFSKTNDSLNRPTRYVCTH